MVHTSGSGSDGFKSSGRSGSPRMIIDSVSAPVSF